MPMVRNGNPYALLLLALVAGVLGHVAFAEDTTLESSIQQLRQLRQRLEKSELEIMRLKNEMKAQSTDQAALAHTTTKLAIAQERKKQLAEQIQSVSVTAGKTREQLTREAIDGLKKAFAGGDLSAGAKAALEEAETSLNELAAQTKETQGFTSHYFYFSLGAVTTVSPEFENVIRTSRSANDRYQRLKDDFKREVKAVFSLSICRRTLFEKSDEVSSVTNRDVKLGALSGWYGKKARLSGNFADLVDATFCKSDFNWANFTADLNLFIGDSAKTAGNGISAQDGASFDATFTPVAWDLMYFNGEMRPTVGFSVGPSFMFSASVDPHSQRITTRLGTGADLAMAVPNVIVIGDRGFGVEVRLCAYLMIFERPNVEKRKLNIPNDATPPVSIDVEGNYARVNKFGVLSQETVTGLLLSSHAKVPILGGASLLLKGDWLIGADNQTDPWSITIALTVSLEEVMGLFKAK